MAQSKYSNTYIKGYLCLEILPRGNRQVQSHKNMWYKKFENGKLVMGKATMTPI